MRFFGRFAPSELHRPHIRRHLPTDPYRACPLSPCGRELVGEINWDGRKPSIDLRGSVKVRGEFSLSCLVHNVKKIVKRMLDGTVILPGKYDRLCRGGLEESGYVLH